MILGAAGCRFATSERSTALRTNIADGGFHHVIFVRLSINVLHRRPNNLLFDLDMERKMQQQWTQVVVRQDHRHGVSSN
jgi:hypothetical protein